MFQKLCDFGQVTYPKPRFSHLENGDTTQMQGENMLVVSRCCVCVKNGSALTMCQMLTMAKQFAQKDN